MSHLTQRRKQRKLLRQKKTGRGTAKDEKRAEERERQNDERRKKKSRGRSITGQDNGTGRHGIRRGIKSRGKEQDAGTRREEKGQQETSSEKTKSDDARQVSAKRIRVLPFLFPSRHALSISARVRKKNDGQPRLDCMDRPPLSKWHSVRHGCVV